MEQRRGRHLLAGVELLPFSPKVEHLRNVFAGGPHCRMPAMRTEVQITGLRKEGDFSHDPIFNDDHGPRHDDQRRAGRETREGRGRGEGEKKGERSWGVMTVEWRNKVNKIVDDR